MRTLAAAERGPGGLLVVSVREKRGNALSFLHPNFVPLPLICNHLRSCGELGIITPGYFSLYLAIL
jgi:hypothetical protein